MRLFSFLQRNKTPAREPAGMAASPAEQVQAARARARRRLIGAVVLLGLGIVGFPLLFETQPRPLPVDVTIEIPRKDGGAPLVLPPRVAPITESADDAGREVPPPVAAASAPAARPVTPAPPAAVVPAMRPVTPAAAAASTPRPAASAPRAVAGASQAAEAAAPAKLPPPIKVLPDTAEAERRPAAPVARETLPAREPQREVAKDKPPVKEAAKEAARDKEPAREVARDKPPAREAAKEAAKDKEPARDPIRELVKDKEKDKDRAEAAVEKRYVVQVGAFADTASASEARARVEKLGIRSYTQEIQTDAGRRIRVRVGPFSSREEADKALGKLRAAGLATALLPQP